MAYPYPDINPSVIDINSKTVALTGNNSVLIKHHSVAKATMNPVAYGGAAIDLDLCIIRNGTATAYGTELIHHIVSDNLFTFSVEDSAGRVTSTGLAPLMIDYTNLTCYVSKAKSDGSGNVDLGCWGAYFNGSFGAQWNSLTVQCRYRVSGGSWSGYTTMTISYTGGTYYAYTTLTGLDYEQSYDFEFVATDKLTEATASTANIKCVPVFHWGENDVVFEVPTTFNGDAQVKGNLRLKGNGNYGNYLYFGDGSYCYIAELSDDAMTIKANQINFDTNSFTVKGQTVAASGTWTPYLPSGTVQSYTSRSGWYTKVGNVVTVGFYIKAIGATSGIDVEITGLPYTPAYYAAGGGMCSGAVMVGDYNFQCFVAETSGVITTRVQACDSTDSKPLKTSRTGCWMPSGSEITVSGTITYMTN